LSFPLDQFSVGTDPKAPAALVEVIGQPGESNRWQMTSLDVGDNYSAAVLVECCSDEPVSIQCWEMDAA